MSSMADFATALWAKIDRTPEGTEDWQWVCGKDGDRLFYAKQLAEELDLDLDRLIAGQHRCCDCEIVFNGLAD